MDVSSNVLSSIKDDTEVPYALCDASINYIVPIYKVNSRSPDCMAMKPLGSAFV